MDLKQHPLSAAWPPLPDMEFQSLIDSISELGVMNPITLCDGMVLDGWNRYRAAESLGMSCPTLKFDESIDIIKFVDAQNRHRRHLTASERAAVVIGMRGYQRPGKKSKGAPGAPLPKLAELAREAQVSPRTIKQAITAEKAGLLEVVRDGGMTAKEADKVARGSSFKPKKKTKPKPASPAEPDPVIVAKLEETQEAVAVLSEENDRLNDRLAVEGMDATAEEKKAAAETIADLRAKVKTLEVELRAVKASRDSYMAENQQLKQQCAAQRREIDRAAA